MPPSGCEAEGAPLAEGDAPPLPLRAPLRVALPSAEALREGSAQGDAEGEREALPEAEGVGAPPLLVGGGDAVP